MTGTSDRQVWRWLLSWACFWPGHWLSVLLRWEGMSWLYPLYNKLMLWSHDVQGPSTFGPWKGGKS